jgi:hypothetical protein
VIEIDDAKSETRIAQRTVRCISTPFQTSDFGSRLLLDRKRNHILPTNVFTAWYSPKEKTTPRTMREPRSVLPLRGSTPPAAASRILRVETRTPNAETRTRNVETHIASAAIRVSGAETRGSKAGIRIPEVASRFAGAGWHILRADCRKAVKSRGSLAEGAGEAAEP